MCWCGVSDTVQGQVLPLYKTELHIASLNVNAHVEIKYILGVFYSFSLLALYIIKVLSLLL